LPTQQGRLRHEISYFFKRNGILPTVLAETQDTSLQKLFAARGMCLIVEPFHAVQEQVENGQLILVGELEQNQSYYLSCAERSVNRGVIDKIMSSISSKQI